MSSQTSNGPAIWDLVVTKPAQKQLEKLPSRDKARVQAILRTMRENPFGGDILRLRAEPSSWRRRVGNYRIFFDLYPERLLVVVTGVVRRTSTTY